MKIGEILFQGEWTEDQVLARWDASLARCSTPEIDAEIERRWAEWTAKQPRAFDGALVRAASVDYSPERIELCCGPAGYRDYVGTHAFPGAVDEHRANPLSVCCAVRTADARIVVGLRSGTVESPGKWHVVAGHVERERHVRGGRVLPFDTVRDELREELGIAAADIEELICTGMTRAPVALKPELTFFARVSLTMDQLRIDDEHARIAGIPASPASIEQFLATHDVTAPGRACLRSCAPALERRYW